MHLNNEFMINEHYDIVANVMTPAQEQGCAEYSDKVNTLQTLVSLRQIRKCSVSSRQYIDVNITIEREVH